MKTKQKLYQFLQGESRGKIVALTSVENEDGTTYLNFDDGSRCNVEFVGALNDARAYTDGKFVAEVYDRTNIWTFEDKSIKDDVRYGTLKDTGEVVEGWDPYIHGQYGNENKRKSSIKAFPPKHVVTKKEMNAGAEKLKELGIDPSTPGYEEGLRSLTIPTQSDLQNKMGLNNINLQNNKGGNYENVERGQVVDDKGNVIGKTTLGLDPTGAKAPSAKDLEQYQRATEIYIPDDIFESTAEKVEVQPEMKPEVSVSKKLNETVDTILNERNNPEPQKNKINISSPVYSIVSKCKKKDVCAPLTLSLQLPGKSIYNLIKDEFGDESIDEFFDIILNDISIEEIKKSLKEALKQSYEPQSSNE